MNEIEYLEFPDGIRKRYGMYIGTNENANVLIREIIDNSIDEFYNNNNKKNLLYIYINNNKILVADNGRGIPLKNHISCKDADNNYYTQARLAIEKLHTGSKFNNKNLYISIGTNGVGAAVVNALSDVFILFVNMKCYSNYSDKIKNLKKKIIGDNLYYMVEYKKGILQNETLINLSNEYIENKLGLKINFNIKNMSTLVYFSPDFEIIQSKQIMIPDLSYKKYISKLLYKKNINIYINDKEYTEIFNPYKYQFKSIINDNIFLVSFELSDKLEKEKFSGSVNGLIVNHGVHKDWVIKAYRAAIKEYFGNLNTYESYGLLINVIILSSNPHYTSQIKTELSQLDNINYLQVKQLIENFKLIFKKNYNEFKHHYDQLVIFTSKLTNINKKSILESKLSLSIKSNRFIKPEKLTDCYTTNRKEAELFIVEGDSAGGGIIAARNPEIHAIYALKGKPLNSVNLDILDVLENKEMNELILSIGTGVDYYNDLSKIRYGKIFLVSDEDTDGQHIKMLLVGFFLSHMKYLIEAGMIYITKNPLYTQNHKFYLASEYNKLDKTKPYTRFKGLGECNPDQLYQFLLDKDKRVIQRLVLGNIEEVKELLVSSEKKRDIMIDNQIFKFNNSIKDIVSN